MTAVSIIVPAYNNADDIGALLDGLNAQTFDPTRVEYIIVNNNSRDATRAVVEAYSRTSRIVLRCVDENAIQSSYAARNTGVLAAVGDILLFTDSDCVPASDWVERMVEAFDDPEVGIVGGTILPGEGASLVEAFSSSTDVLSQEHCLNHSFRPFFQTANVAFRREVFAEAGLFRSHLKTGGDADMCWRVQELTDYELRSAEKAVVRHHHRSTLKGLQEQFTRYGRSAVYLDLLHGSGTPSEPGYPYLVRKAAAWLFFKYPRLLLRHARGEATKVDVYGEPLRLYARWCRKRGIAEAARTGLSGELPVAQLVERTSTLIGETVR
jgi:cellulose synthase/poly-beta-1,6-N-acetylglucosamine synthase-like glycosyltransferase